MNEIFFSDEDLAGVFAEMDEENNKKEVFIEDDKEMDASQRRYMEIIQKHKNI